MTVADSGRAAIPRELREARAASGKLISIPMAYFPQHTAGHSVRPVHSCADLAACKVNGLLTQHT
jgi:hypothetical protein